MDSRRQESTSFISRTGQPRPSDVAITVLTAMILLLILVFVAVW